MRFCSEPYCKREDLGEGLCDIHSRARLQRELEEALAELQNRGGVLFKIVEVLIAAGIDMNGSTILKGLATLRERAEGLERERQHAVDALQRCDEDREVLRERAERAEALAELREIEADRVTQERDALLLESGDAHRRAGRVQGSSRALSPADPKKADHK